MIVETTNYYALPGQSSAVLAQRRHASAIRTRLGLPAGRIFTKLEGAGPDVRWECTFDTREAYEADMAARAACEEFAVARQSMHQLLERFERHVEEEAC
ncbi:hypothetical protein WKW77_27055 [Variovorax ureilyticus]|uniref:DUF4242 domain-containing protein n=1 Tax=Variovorax ureilyticus TaxID=1836198 RepID=A0ABU8VPB0_9BURK